MLRGMIVAQESDLRKAVPSSSAAIERLFSVMGILLNARRNSLSVISEGFASRTDAENER